jgi:hypothetical protein
MSEQRLFAGFWRDGAVLEPGEKHYVNDRCVFAVHKKDGALDLCTETYEYWHKVFWLDTTTPTQLTPQEAFEVLRVISPTATRLELKHGYPILDSYEPIVNWNGTTEYPPLQTWRVPTDADKGKACRCWDNVGGRSDLGRFVAIFDSGFLTTSSSGFMIWDNCEVLED